jgi:hypothetical protein
MTRKFIAPNFRYTSEDQDGGPITAIVFAESEDDLKRRLKARGLMAISIQPFDFFTWLRRAEEETERVVKASSDGAKLKFNALLWQQLKRHLFELFNGKCAYCDSKVQHIASGDVEHYRPKRMVEENRTHPGYFWLAYVPENLLPCCELCNRARGKKNHFPVRGVHSMTSGGVKDEEPLLFNPYLHDPVEHFFHESDSNGLNLDIARGKTDIGSNSCRIYRLNREELMGARSARRCEFLREIRYYLNKEDMGAVHKLIGEATAGDLEFYVMCLSALERFCFEEEQKLHAIRDHVGPLPESGLRT